jgi:DNA repair photolyase
MGYITLVMETKFTEIEASSALHYHSREFATNWDMNIYRGCGHRCRYCFAQYTHYYLNSDNFFDEIFVKTNISDVLEKDMSKRTWANEPVNICGVTDCYQPAEVNYQLVPKVLKRFIQHKNPIVITTKSKLIERDFELIRELHNITEVRIGISVTTVNEKLRRILEPYAAPTIDRFKALEKFAKIGCKTAVLLMPIIPYMTDFRPNLDEIFRLTKESGTKRLLAWPLHLRGNTKGMFFSFLKESYPELLPKYREMYYKSNVTKEYFKYIMDMVFELRCKYSLFNPEDEPDRPPVQPTLFD